jgi:hypothetical protein
MRYKALFWVGVLKLSGNIIAIGMRRNARKNFCKLGIIE